MSTLEKLLVLGVLVLVGVILAISLFWTRDVGGMTGGTDVSAAAKEKPAGSLPDSPVLPGNKVDTAAPAMTVDALARGAESRPANSGINSADGGIGLRTAAIAPPSPLVRPTSNPDFWVYTARTGDTPQSVSAKLTGSQSSASKIWIANDRASFVPGRDVLIPGEVFLNAKAPAPEAPKPIAETTPPAKPLSTGLASPTPPAATPTATGAPKKHAASETDAGTADRTYKVKQGDTLRSIARAQLKDERRWKDIVELNHISGEIIRAGQTIKLPAGK